MFRQAEGYIPVTLNLPGYENVLFIRPQEESGTNNNNTLYDADGKSTWMTTRSLHTPRSLNLQHHLATRDRVINQMRNQPPQPPQHDNWAQQRQQAASAPPSWPPQHQAPPSWPPQHQAPPSWMLPYDNWAQQWRQGQQAAPQLNPNQMGVGQQTDFDLELELALAISASEVDHARPAPVSSAPINIKQMKIPGTSNTFGDIAHMLSIRPTVSGDELEGSCGIHHAFKNLVDIEGAFNILNQFYISRGNPPILDTASYSNQEARELEQRFANMLEQSLPQSDKAGFRDPTRRRNMIISVLDDITGKQSALAYGADYGGGQFRRTWDVNGKRYSGYYMYRLLITFLESYPDVFQPEWSEYFMTDSIEGYDTTVDTYVVGDRIGCGPGIMERGITYVSDIILSKYQQAVVAKQPAVVAKQPAVVVAKQPAVINRRKFFIGWHQRYEESAKDEATIEGLRDYIIRNIRAREDNNNLADWTQALNSYIEEVRSMFGGSRKYMRRSIHKKYRRTNSKTIRRSIHKKYRRTNRKR